MTNDTSTQVRVIEGYITAEDHGPGYELGNGAGWTDFAEGNIPNKPDVSPIEGVAPATLIIGDKGVSKTQVIEMLRNIIMDNQVFISRRGDVNATEIDDIKAIAAKFGFTDL